MEEAKRLIQEAHHETIALLPKSGVGIAGSFMAMSINDLMGLIVGILTAIYMFLQIQDVLRKRKDAEKIKIKKKNK